MFMAFKYWSFLCTFNSAIVLFLVFQLHMWNELSAFVAVITFWTWMLLLAPWHCHTSWSYISELWNVPNKTNPRYPWDKKKKKTNPRWALGLYHWVCLHEFFRHSTLARVTCSVKLNRFIYFEIPCQFRPSFFPITSLYGNPLSMLKWTLTCKHYIKAGGMNKYMTWSFSMHQP